MALLPSGFQFGSITGCHLLEMGRQKKIYSHILPPWRFIRVWPCLSIKGHNFCQGRQCISQSYNSSLSVSVTVLFSFIWSLRAAKALDNWGQPLIFPINPSHIFINNSFIKLHSFKKFDYDTSPIRTLSDTSYLFHFSIASEVRLLFYSPLSSE